MYNRFKIVKDLIVAGSDINSATNDGVTALMFGKVKAFLFTHIESHYLF